MIFFRKTRSVVSQSKQTQNRKHGARSFSIKPPDQLKRQLHQGTETVHFLLLPLQQEHCYVATIAIIRLLTISLFFNLAPVSHQTPQHA
jgi:hypothetical protein